MYMNQKIHIVEDDEDIRYIIAYILSEMGYQVNVSETIKDFSEQLLNYKPDLMLIDVMLPDGNGLDLCLELKKYPETNKIPIIVMSAHAAEEFVLQKACAEDFISKPFDLEDLVTLIKKHLPVQ